MTRDLFLSLGSNSGDREAHLRQAVAALRNHMEIVHVSSVWRTAPYGVTDQPDFLNIALAARSDLEPYRLLRTVKDIERKVGRRPTYKWGPRVVDIDIVLYGDTVLTEPDLTIPHADMRKRQFVLAPLQEIAAEVVDPVSGNTVQDLLASLGPLVGVEKIAPLYDVATQGDTSGSGAPGIMS